MMLGLAKILEVSCLNGFTSASRHATVQYSTPPNYWYSAIIWIEQNMHRSRINRSCQSLAPDQPIQCLIPKLTNRDNQDSGRTEKSQGLVMLHLFSFVFWFSNFVRASPDERIINSPWKCLTHSQPLTLSFLEFRAIVIPLGPPFWQESKELISLFSLLGISGTLINISLIIYWGCTYSIEFN